LVKAIKNETDIYRLGLGSKISHLMLMNNRSCEKTGFFCCDYTILLGLFLEFCTICMLPIGWTEISIKMLTEQFHLQ
jgi:hypothetical protein